MSNDCVSFISKTLDISVDKVLKKESFCFHLEDKKLEDFVIELLKVCNGNYTIGYDCKCGNSGKYIRTEDISLAGFILTIISLEE